MKNIPDHLRQHSITSFHDVIPINNRFLAISGSQHTCWRGAKALQCVRSRRSAQRTQWVNRMAQLWTEVATALQSPDKAAGNPAVSRLGNPEHIRIPVRLRRPSRHEPLNLLIYSTGPEAISIFEPDLAVLQNRAQPYMKELLPFLEREMGKIVKAVPPDHIHIKEPDPLNEIPGIRTIQPGIKHCSPSLPKATQ
ncbi:hypothetical protein [uncultured Stenotrophomonas sp.]|uniref:hypothetical protein n=1 Tax=uncultured Stenotrophomonas sp. TaxID=165438 RepID=UPI0025E49894|nr:hypothetical protein [uncultured Stenotrophomonas sp.]